MTGDVKGAVDVMEERLTEVKVMKQMELTETTRKLGKCTEVKVTKQMELNETTRKLGKCNVVKVMKQIEPKVHKVMVTKQMELTESSVSAQKSRS